MGGIVTAAPLLTVEDLWIKFQTPHRVVEAVRGVSFAVGREKVGIVGESGSGKSMTGRSILKLTPGNAEVSARRIEFDGIDLMAASERDMLQIRGRRIAMIMQDPKFSLDPVMRVGDQIAEALTARVKLSRAETRERVLAMLEAVRIRNPRRVYGLYPHEVSGGMGQRVMIAMMLMAEPALLIADEPEDFALLNRKGDAVDGGNGAVAPAEGDVEAVDRDCRLGHRPIGSVSQAGSRLRTASRRRRSESRGRDSSRPRV